VPLALSVGVVGLLLQLVSVSITISPPGLAGIPTIIDLNSSGRQWIVFAGFGITMLLTAWLAIKILKDIDKAFYNSSEQKSALV
jgi:hypothetical protein